MQDDFEGRGCIPLPGGAAPILAYLQFIRTTKLMEKVRHGVDRLPPLIFLLSDI